MVGAIGGSGNGWGQFKKAMEELAQKARQASQNSNNTTPKVTEASAPVATAPVAAAEPVASVPPATETAPPAAPAPVVANEPAAVSDSVDVSSSPSILTYSAPSPAPRTMAAPETTLDEQLSDAGYYASPAASAVPDPVAPAQQENAAALSQAQVIAQAAYALVARAGEDHRLSLIQKG